MRVWIDLANSPHPLLFAPIAERLEAAGAEIAVTVRDHAQTLELTLQTWPEAEVIGGASPAGRLAKPRSIAGRVAELARWARRERPAVALSHNSYAQILAARSLRIPAVTGMDYEHQPANHLAFRAASRILMPEALPERVVRRQGARPGKVVRYAGLKEEVYLAEVDAAVDPAEQLGVDPGERALAVARAAPAGAAYHPGENPLFERALTTLDRRGNHLIVILARHPEQRRAADALGLENAVIPERALEAPALLLATDLFLGAGGTMTREAALLGVPTYSLFAGRPAAVDGLLERRGALRRLTDPEQLAAADPASEREGRAERLAGLRREGARIAEAFVTATMAAAARAPRSR